MPRFLCTPNTTRWEDATTASVEGIDPPLSPVDLSVEHRSAGEHLILKSTYPHGVLLIPNGNDPASNPAILPGVTSSGSSIVLTLDPEDPEDMPAGGIGLFVE